MPHDPEDRLREALRARAEEIEPDPAAWVHVRRRIRRRHRRTAAAVGAAAVLLVFAVASAVPALLPGQEVELDPATAPEAIPAEPEEGPEAPEPEAEVDPEPTPTPEAEAPAPPDEPAEQEAVGASEVTVFFAREQDGRWWVEPERHRLSPPTVGMARAALELLAGGQAHHPARESVSPAGAAVLGVSRSGEVLVVDFSGELADATRDAAEEEAFAQQLAHTAAQFDGVERLRLRVDGSEISTLWGHHDWSSPVEPDPFALAPVTLETHAFGEEVDVGAVTVGGHATTFEATIKLRLVDPDGTVVAEPVATATAGAPERGWWEHTFELDRPGTWRVEAAEPDPSGGAEGRPPFVVRTELVAR